MAELAPLETRYGGCRFRSRTEARWAVFFDALGVPWEYEPEAYPTSLGNYLPDFRLRGGPFAEVKPDSDDRTWLPKVEAFAKEHRQEVVLLVGQPSGQAYDRIRPDGQTDAVAFKSETPGVFGRLAVERAVQAAKGARFDRGEDVELPGASLPEGAPTWKGYIRKDETDDELQQRIRTLVGLMHNAGDPLLESLFLRAQKRLEHELTRRHAPPRPTRADYTMDAILGGAR